MAENNENKQAALQKSEAVKRAVKTRAAAWADANKDLIKQAEKSRQEKQEK